MLASQFSVGEPYFLNRFLVLQHEVLMYNAHREASTTTTTESLACIRTTDSFKIIRNLCLRGAYASKDRNQTPSECEHFGCFLNDVHFF